MQFIDMHTHLQDKKFIDIDNIIKTSYQKGVKHFVICGTNQKDWKKVSEIHENYKDITTPCFGVHPWFVKCVDKNWKNELNEYLDKYPNALIGEIGLDRWKDDIKDEKELQHEIFSYQYELAKEKDRAVVIHCIKAWGWLNKYLYKNRVPKKFMLHSFNGSAEIANKICKFGGYISLSASILRNSKKERILNFIPNEQLLIETDSPDQSPYKGKINTPENLIMIAKNIAEIKDIDINEFAEITYKNSIGFIK